MANVIFACTLLILNISLSSCVCIFPCSSKPEFQWLVNPNSVNSITGLVDSKPFLAHFFNIFTFYAMCEILVFFVVLGGRLEMFLRGFLYKKRALF